jgi:hypothetical protein
MARSSPKQATTPPAKKIVKRQTTVPTVVKSAPAMASPRTGYGSVLGESWKTVWRRTATFLPIAYTILGCLLIILIIAGIGIATYGMDFSRVTMGGFVALIGLGLLALVFFIVHGMAFMVGTLTLIARKEENVVGEAFRFANANYWRTFRVGLALLVTSLPIMVLAGLAILFFYLTKNTALFLIPGIILAVVAVAMMVFYGAWFVFVGPMLGNTKMGAWEIVGASWRNLWDDSRRVWSVYGIKFGIGLAIGIVIAAFSAMVADPAGEAPGWFNALNMLVNIILGAWLGLFTFTTYLMKER